MKLGLFRSSEKRKIIPIFSFQFSVSLSFEDHRKVKLLNVKLLCEWEDFWGSELSPKIVFKILRSDNL